VLLLSAFVCLVLEMFLVKELCVREPNQMPKHGSIAYCFLAMRTPLNVDAGAVSLSGPRSPSSSQIAA
jgi:hypothetical protein